ncbi:vWA domain-containing protein [Paractinoplanes lichenicola]|uniref:VWFA domain-containing protein n=1 Tax=Paractinoplanes lichenicola TaxID=2802976 RepID=A0ABS1VDL4_9ACTN|nr:hypothetical protein [Actinoplanes lichenicola]MBL7252710.1 hypothetical protein [Actinoplanes lichenicola]
MTDGIGFGFEPDDDLDDFEPNEESHRRRLVLLLFDLSGSMGVTRNAVRPVDSLNTHIERWLPQVHERGADELRNVEFAVLTFGSKTVRLHAPGGRVEFGEDGAATTGQVPQDGGFMPAAKLRIDRFTAGGTTPMVSALRVALRLGDERAAALGAAGVTTGPVRLILFTDGSPNDKNLPRDAWHEVAADLAERREKRRTHLLAFGVPESDDRVLRALAGDRGYFPLSGFDFGKLLELITIASSAHDPYDGLRSLFEDEQA